MTRKDHALGFLRYFFPASSIVELRAFNQDTGYTVSGKYTDFERMAADAIELDREPALQRVHFVVNPIDPDKAGPIAVAMNTYATNRIQFPLRTTSDADVSARNVYFIDFDPERQSGVCSTDSEKQAAWERATLVCEFLRKQGWPEPLIVDSGNGFHLYYRADNCPVTRAEWRAVLMYLSQAYSDDAVKIDTSVYSPAQLSRVPGTRNLKGPNTPERPHRDCLTVQVPKTWELVTHAQVAAMAEAVGVTPKIAEKIELAPLADDVDEQIKLFCEDYGLEVAVEFEKDGKLWFALKECPVKGAPHKGQGRKSCIIRSDVSVGFKCFSDDCDSYSMQDLRNHLEETTGIKSEARFYECTWDPEAAIDELEAAIERWGLDLEEFLDDNDFYEQITDDQRRRSFLALSPSERVEVLNSFVEAEATDHHHYRMYLSTMPLDERRAYLNR